MCIYVSDGFMVQVLLLYVPYGHVLFVTKTRAIQSKGNKKLGIKNLEQYKNLLYGREVMSDNRCALVH